MALPPADVIIPIASPTPFRNLLSEFAKLIDSQGISIDMLIKSIDNLGEEYKTFTVEDEYINDFKALVRDELSNRVNSLFKDITDKLIATNPHLAKVFQLPNNSDKDFEKIGNFTIHLSYHDTKTKTNKVKEVILTYGELLTKYNTFKNIIQSAFSNIELITTQREFTESFFNDAVSTINMHVSTSRDFFDTEGVSKQCDTANSIKWPYELIPGRFSDSYLHKDWTKYCYICGKEINANNGPSQCEHILPVFQACTFNCLIQVSTDLVNATPERQALYKLEYAGSHPCCNILKSNNSFINIDPTRDPPISINYNYIYTLLTIINSKASNNNSDCYDLLIANIAEQVNVIDKLYLKDLVTHLNNTLKTNNGTFATSGIILLFLTINQFIAFQPAIEQTIISILSGGIKKIKKMMQFKLHSIDTFCDKELSQIMKLAYDSKEEDTKNYLDFIGLITNEEYENFLRYIQQYVQVTPPARRFVQEAPLGAPPSEFFYTNIRDMMSHMKPFEYHKIFLNTDNFNKMEEMTNPSNYKEVSYPNAGNNLFQEKIKYFFKSLVFQFYGVKSGDDESWFTTISNVQISKKEKNSLIEFCKAYIGLEFLYIIIYKLSKLGSTLEQPFIDRLQNCYEKYKQYYITFINYFFIYQSFYILSTNDDITIANLFPTASMDGGDIKDLEKTIIYYAGTTYYNIWNILLIKDKSILEQFVTKAVEIMNTVNTEEEINKMDEETVNITNGVNILTFELVKILTELFDDPEVKRCLIIYKIDMGHAKPLGSAKIHDLRNLIPLPELPQAGGVRESVVRASNKNRSKLTSEYAKHIRQDNAIKIRDAIRDRNRDMNRDMNSMQLDKLETMQLDELETMQLDELETMRLDGLETMQLDKLETLPLDKLRTFIDGIKSFNQKSLLTELSSKSTHYNLRQNPTQMLQLNMAGPLNQQIKTFSSANFAIYVYEPAIYLDIYRCILIDKLFEQKIKDMINTKTVYSNDEILTDEDIALLQNVITGDFITGDYPLLKNNKYFFTITNDPYSKYLYLFTKCNLFLFYHSTSGYITDLFDNKLYATQSVSKGGGKKYYKNITKKLKKKKIVKKTKEKLKTKSRKHKSRKHKSRKHKSRKHKSRKHKSKFTKTLKK